MDIIRRGDIPLVPTDGSDETRRYYDYPRHGFRVVETCLPPGHVQNEHRHAELLDVTLVIEGEIQVTRRREGVLVEETLKEGDMVRFAPPDFHNVANKSGETARTLTLKMRRDSGLSPEALTRLFKTDWYGYREG